MQTTTTVTRRLALWSLLGAALLGACATPPPAPTPDAPPPIVFVHGNGDSAAMCAPTLWRFESNGWPRERLHAIDVPYPVARDDDGKPQEGRTSTMALNAPKGPKGDEVTRGPKWMTIRSDNNDLYAQPDGAFIGAKGQPTHVSFDGPDLKGAQNVVLFGIDHRETALHAGAFAKAYEFITGKPPATTAITPESNIVLDGKVSGLGANHTQGSFANNLPHAVRLADADKDAKSVVTLTHPRGYFTLPRDRVSLDGAPPPSVAAGVGSVSAAKLKITDTPGRAVSAEFNGERTIGRAWPAADNRLVWLELHH